VTQRQLVLALLDDGLWHSSIEFVNEGVLRAAARVFELRGAGYPIESRVARQGGARVFEYRLRQLSANEELVVERAREAFDEFEREDAPEPEQLRLDEEGAA
jgi:Helix-turn-helix domain